MTLRRGCDNEPVPSTERRLSPAAARALRILETLAADPSRGLTLTELRRELRFSHGNLHAILATMEAAGHVRRDATTKAYFLGPALIGIGAAARATYPAVETAMPFMESLAAELDTECRAGMRAGDEILVVARVGPQQPEGYGVTVGERFPLTPPLGLSYLAWSSEEDIEAYLASAADDLGAAQLARYRDAIEALRGRGYAVNLESPPQRALVDTANRILAEASREGYEQQLTDLAHEIGRHAYVLTGAGIDAIDVGHVLHVGAPVFGPDGTVELVVGVSFVTPYLAGHAITDVAELVVAATQEITRKRGGRAPEPPR